MDSEDAPQWEDLNTDEINSVDSEELHQYRPNRWTGNSTTWRYLTEGERSLYRSMKLLEDQDLSVHLYDSFALKQRALNPDAAKDVIITSQDGRSATWRPPKIWTAWPMKTSELRLGSLSKQQAENGGVHHARRLEEKFPASAELQDEITASILRSATKRLRRRLRSWERLDGQDAADDGLTMKQSPDEIQHEYSASKAGTSQSEHGDLDLVREARKVKSEFDRFSPYPKHAARKDHYHPAVSADDDLSNSLLRQSVRSILTKLDETLAVLHHSRIAGLCDSIKVRKVSKKKHAVPGTNVGTREKSVSAEASSEGRDFPPKALASDKRTGRPWKPRERREGETEEEFQIRTARKSHSYHQKSQESVKEAAFEAWLRQGEENERLRSASPDSMKSTSNKERSGAMRPNKTSRMHITHGPEDDESDQNIAQIKETRLDSRGQRFDRFGLRDWSDILGAAAIAGFSEEVIQRSAQRCANLFGQGMSFRRLKEVATRDDLGKEEVVYQPQRVDLPSSQRGSGMSDAADEEYLSDPARLALQRILSHSSHSSWSSTSAALKSPTSAMSMSSHMPLTSTQSESGSESHLRHFCPVPGCYLVPKGFSQRGNLRRHVRSRHPDFAWRDMIDHTAREVTESAASQSEGALRYLCPVQGCSRARQGFSHRTNFRRHMRSKHPDDPWHSVKNRQERMASEPVPIKSDNESGRLYICRVDGCPRSSEGFLSRGALSRHITENHSDDDWLGDSEGPPPQVEVGTETDKQEDTIEYRRMFFCPVEDCPKATAGIAHQRNFTRHMLHFHPDHPWHEGMPDTSRLVMPERKILYYCPVQECSWSYRGISRLQNLDLHMRRKHPSHPWHETREDTSRPISNTDASEKTFHCPVVACPRHEHGFARRFGLKRHMRTQHPNQVSSEQEGQENHEDEDDRPGQDHDAQQHLISMHFCPVQNCPRSQNGFRDQYHLKRHVQLKHKSHPWLQSLEETSRMVSVSLQQHEKHEKQARATSETQNRSHLCPVASCPRSAQGFARPRQLRRHIQLVHGENQSIALDTSAAKANSKAVSRKRTSDQDSDDSDISSAGGDGTPAREPARLRSGLRSATNARK